MRRLLLFPLFVLSIICMAAVANAQSTAESKRDETRDRLRQLLATAGQRKDINTTFRQATKQPYNFTATMREGHGFTNVDELEIVISVTSNDTIGFRVYPHYKGAYINVDKTKDPLGFARKLLLMSDKNFLYWGMDNAGDTFAGYTVTLESGFPTEAIVIVLRSIKNTDGFVGELRPLIDGSSGGPTAHTTKGL